MTDRDETKVKVLRYLLERGPRVDRSHLLGLMPYEDAVPSSFGQKQHRRMTKGENRATRGNRRAIVLKRWLVRWKESGLVHLTPTHVTVLDREGLRERLDDMKVTGPV